MRILVTGARGFIGSNLTSFLLNKGVEVIGYDNLSNESILSTDRMKQESGENWKNFKYYQMDIRATDSLNSIFYNESPDYVVHLAARGSVPKSFINPGDYIDNNERGFANILMASALSKVKRVIYASSSSVYGSNPKSLRSESDSPLPQSPYALTKLHNEQLARVFGSYCGLETTGLRFFNVYGPGQNSQSVYAAVIPKFFNSSAILINGDGSQVRDFTFVSDVCEAVYASINSKDSNMVLNVGTGIGTTIKNIAELISRGEKQIENREPRFGDIPTSIADLTNIRKILKWEPRVQLEHGIEIMRTYYMKYGICQMGNMNENSL